MALVAISVIAAVAYTLRPREAVAPPPPIEKLDPKVKIVTIAGDAIQLKGARQDLKIEFERQATYSGRPDQAVQRQGARQQSQRARLHHHRQ